jgi:hypothetical protein
MAQKQVIRWVVLVSTIVPGGLCRAQPLQDLKAAKSTALTKAVARPSSEKLKEKVSTPVESQPRVTTLTTGPRIRISPEASSRLIKMAPDMVLRLKRAVTQVDWGTPKYDPPAPMECGQEQTIVVTFARTMSPSELRKRLAEKMDTLKPDQIDVSSLVKADLRSGKAFLINAVSSAEQPVAGTQKGLWKWVVIANEPGRHPLFLELSSELLVGGEKIPCDIQADELTVNVAPAPGKPIYQRIWEFWKAHWQWLWTAILVPVAGVLWKLLRKKKAKASEPPKPEDTTEAGRPEHTDAGGPTPPTHHAGDAAARGSTGDVKPPPSRESDG